MKINSSTRLSLMAQLKELWQYRELIHTFVVRDIKARYRQTTIGIAWAVIQPLFLTGIFTIVFSKFLKVSTGGVPYPVFSYIALAVWTFISRSIIASSTNIISNYGIFSKVYFPREVIPLSTVVSSLVDFTVASGLSILLLLVYRIPLTWQVSLLPLIIIIQVLLACALALAAAGLTVIFRDLQFAFPFLVQLLMYASPVVFSVRNLQSRFKTLFYFNPITGVIEGYRSILLYHELPNFVYLSISTGFALALLLVSYLVFKRIEKYLADVV
jgi:lipopolysaccharide transport system permease protein